MPPMVEKALNRSLLIGACSTECRLRCVYTLHIDMGLCVGTFECVCVFGGFLERSHPVLS